MGVVSEPILSLPTVGGLVELARDLATTTDLQAVLDAVCRAMVDVADFEAAAINLVSDSGHLKVVAVAGPPDVREALLGQVSDRREWDAELASCVPHHGLLLSTQPDRDRLRHSWTSDDSAWFERTAGDPQTWMPDFALLVPMTDSAGQMIGVVSVDLPRSGLVPDVAQSATVEMVARQAETAIAAARALARSELNERVYRAAFDIAATLTAIAEPGGHLIDINHAFHDALPDVTHAAAFDRVLPVWEQDGGLCDALELVLAGDETTASFVAADGSGPEARCFRVTVRGIGGYVGAPQRAVCSVVDISVERREQLRHRRDAEHDPLTGLLNRRGARAAMDALLTASAPDTVVAVLACDLDGFKAANDRFGHHVGDAVLVLTARVLRAALPPDSVLVRLGGDEFLLVARCADRDGAEAVAEAVVRAVRSGVVVEDVDVPVTISVGLATAEAGSVDGISGLVDAADRALYGAKAAGRDRWAPQARA